MRRYWEKRTIRRMELEGEAQRREGWWARLGAKGRTDAERNVGMRGLGPGKYRSWRPLTKLRFPSGSQLGHQQLGRRRGQ